MENPRPPRPPLSEAPRVPHPAGRLFPRRPMRVLPFIFHYTIIFHYVKMFFEIL
jgi:hypothetical protein